MAVHRFRNPAVVAQGMLAPSGNRSALPDPFVQSTARPAGSLLSPSPGYDSIRVGKNRFQGKGPTGGFRPMEFAEDIGGSGAALAVIPGAGSTASISASEWLAEPDDAMAGRMIVSDRTLKPGFSVRLHEALSVLPDMGDRSPGRPLTKSQWLYNPIGMFRKDFRESPAITVGASIALILLVNLVATDLERNYRGSRGRGITGAAIGLPVAAAETGGGEAEKAVDTIVKTTDKAVEKIENAATGAVDAIENAAKSITKEV